MKISICYTMNQTVLWDSQMKAQRLRQDIGYNKTVMYWFDRSMDITVEEKQKNNTLDKIILHFTVREGDMAYFGNEYVPVGMKKESTKKPDITAILENSVERKVKWYVYDMKDTVIDAKVALKLCNQWHSGIEHIEGQFLNSLEGYSVESSLGVIFRYWDRDMLQKEKDVYVGKINQIVKNRLLTARKSLPKLDEYRQRVKAVQFILDGVFIDEALSGGRFSYDIHFVYMVTADKVAYTADMDIEF